VRPKVPEDGPIRPKHVVKGNVWYICATNCVDGNCNKAMKIANYDPNSAVFSCLLLLSLLTVVMLFSVTIMSCKQGTVACLTKISNT
jgi:hypothetical protein